MISSKYLKGECQHCGGQLEFPADAAGTMSDCPHCNQPTELFLATPKPESAVPLKTLVWTTITVILLVGALVGVLITLKRAQRLAATHQAATASPAPALLGDTNVPPGFQISAVRLEPARGSAPAYAIGSIRNETDRRRLSVQVELELLDTAGKPVGNVRDYQSTLEPKAEWRFKVPVVESRATAARITSIKEDR